MLSFLPTLGWTEIGFLVVLAGGLFAHEIPDGGRLIASWVGRALRGP